MRVNGDRTPKLNLQLFAEPEVQPEVNPQPNPQAVDNQSTNTGVEGSPEPVENKDHHAFAAMRVKNKEYETKIKEYKSQLESSKQDKEFRDQWAKQNFGSQGINSWDDYKQAYNEQKQKEINYKASQGDPDAIQSIINKKVNETLSKKEQEQEEKRKQLEAQTRVNKQIQSEVEELSNAYELNLESAHDISKLDNSQEIYKLMGAGISAKDAYEFVNRNNLINQEASKVKQATMNQMSGYSHIKPNGGTPGSIKKVPQDVIASYKKMFPGMSIDEIQKHYKG